MRKHHSPARRFSRRLLSLALALLALGGFLWWDNRTLQVERFSCVDPALPEGFDGLRIAVLTDLHGAVYGENNHRLFSAVAEEKPDLIAVVGDLADQYRGIDWENTRTTAAGLSAIAPVYYVTGNHEWAIGHVPELKALLSDAGWHVLSNQLVTLERGGDTVVLTGIDDPNGYADQKTPEALAAEVSAQFGDPYWILLAHRNDRFESQYSLLGADLTLSGHGHGGILRLPGLGGVIGTQRNLFPSYTAGFYEANGARLFVSRGLGNSGFMPRLFNRPQVAVLTLQQS